MRWPAARAASHQATKPERGPNEKLATFAGLHQEAVEAVKGRGWGLGRGNESLPCPAPVEPAVVANDGDVVALGGADPLARGLGDRLEDGGLVSAADERQCDPVARRLDLLDRVEAGGVNGPTVVAFCGFGDFRIRRE